MHVQLVVIVDAVTSYSKGFYLLTLLGNLASSSNFMVGFWE
jgi:hypothetical protein